MHATAIEIRERMEKYFEKRFSHARFALFANLHDDVLHRRDLRTHSHSFYALENYRIG